MTATVSYVPATPAAVASVDRLRLYTTSARTGTPVVDVGPATQQLDGSWLFSFAEPADGYYYSVITVTYTDARVIDDKNDVVQLPPPPALQPDEAWVAAWELESPDDPFAVDAARAASLIMYALSGRKYTGVRSVTETYVTSDWICWTDDPFRYKRSRSWSGRPDSRYRADYLRLRNRPVRSVSEVAVGPPDFTEVLDPATYKVYDRAILELSSGLRQTISVTYTFGANVPAAGRLAARSLANELVKAANGSEECRLPDRVTSVSRQGLSYTILDAQDFLKDGRTGIYEIDLFLKAVNPDNARKKPAVLSPDTPRARRASYP